MSKAEKMGISPSQVSCHTKSYSCPKQITLENTQEFGAECKSSEVLEQKHNLESEFIQTDAEHGSTDVLQSYAGEILQPSAEHATKSSVTDLNPTPDDVLVDKTSGSIVTVIYQKLEHGHAACAQSESSKARDPGIVQDGLRDTSTALPSCIANENMTKSPKDLASNSLIEDAGLPHEDASKSSQIDHSSYPQQAKPGEAFDFSPVKACREPSEERLKPDSEVIQNESVGTGTGTGLPSGIALEQLEPVAQLVTKSSSIVIGLPSGGAINIHANEQSQTPRNDNGNKYFNVENSETPSGHMPGNSSHATCMVKSTPKLLRKKKYMLRSLRKSERVLRSRSQEKPKAPEPSNNLANVNSTGEKKRKRRKNGKKGKRTVADEYSRIRARLRYLLNRMSYEQSLITAYSSEGWKGLSLEKLKPEKELQRATSEISRRKLKIRNLFQHIDSLCAEGRFPASLFDSEGQICSEDIFCAKCGSKDLTADNDIVLCDGACDRGFHQFCLIPPLLKEDIPPDDEGWLCPGCDCKVDCIDLLNNSQGTNLSISDSWEDVFPEAVAATGGQKLDHNFGLSSDDSDDNDYDPNGPDINKNCQGDESSSDESDFTSASDELVAPPNDKQHLGLPSDDSEDDDFDPDAPDLDEKLEQESSSSDFSSDSEDLAATLNDGFSVEDDSHASIESRRDSFGRRSKLNGKKMQSLNSELLILLEPDPGQDASASVSGKRNVERLDYKKLYDETYGNAATSSDDDYTDSPGPRKRGRKITGNNATVSTNGDASMTRNGLNTKDTNQELKEIEPAPKGRIQQMLSTQSTIVSPSKTNARSSGSGSKPRLGEAVTQRLYGFFKENQYPDRSAKESLAKELGITFAQVNKWFTNARWSFHHPSS